MGSTCPGHCRLWVPVFKLVQVKAHITCSLILSCPGLGQLHARAWPSFGGWGAVLLQVVMGTLSVEYWLLATPGRNRQLS